GIFFAHISFEAEMAAVAVSVKLINHRKTRVVAVVVHAADVHEVIKSELLLRGRANVGDLLRVGQYQRGFTAESGGVGQAIAEPGFQFLSKFQSRHEKNLKFQM